MLLQAAAGAPEHPSSCVFVLDLTHSSAFSSVTSSLVCWREPRCWLGGEPDGTAGLQEVAGEQQDVWQQCLCTHGSARGNNTRDVSVCGCQAFLAQQLRAVEWDGAGFKLVAQAVDAKEPSHGKTCANTLALLLVPVLKP